MVSEGSEVYSDLVLDEADLIATRVAGNSEGQQTILGRSLISPGNMGNNMIKDSMPGYGTAEDDSFKPSQDASLDQSARATTPLIAKWNQDIYQYHSFEEIGEGPGNDKKLKKLKKNKKDKKEKKEMRINTKSKERDQKEEKKKFRIGIRHLEERQDTASFEQRRAKSIQPAMKPPKPMPVIRLEMITEEDQGEKQKNSTSVPKIQHSGFIMTPMDIMKKKPSNKNLSRHLSLGDHQLVKKPKRVSQLRRKFQEVNACSNNTEDRRGSELSMIDLGPKRKAWAQKEAENKYVLKNMRMDADTLSDPIKIAIQEAIRSRFQTALEDIEDVELSSGASNLLKKRGLGLRQNSSASFNPKQFSFRSYDRNEDRDENGPGLRRQQTQFLTSGFKNSLAEQIFGPSLPMAKDSNNFEMYNDLVDDKIIYTQFDIVSISFSEIRNMAITLLQSTEDKFMVRMYVLTSNQFSELEIEGKNIKANNVEQSLDGHVFCLTYKCDGDFRATIFDDKGIISDLQVGELLQLDVENEHSESIPNPQICCCFVSSDEIFIVLFHQESQKIWYFFYDIKDHKIKGKPLSFQLEQSYANAVTFPVKAAYVSELKQRKCHFFFRQGQHFQIDYDDTEKIENDQLAVSSLSQVLLPSENLIIAQSSLDVIFFKRNENGKWFKYHQIENGGQLNFNYTEKTLIAVNENEIKFFSLDEENSMPKLLSIFNNHVECQNMIFGPEGRFCISYSSNVPVFNLYQKKYTHTFIANLHHNYEDYQTLISLNLHKEFMIAKKNKLQFFCQKTLNEKQEIQININTRHQIDNTWDGCVKPLCVQTNITQTLVGIIFGHTNKAGTVNDIHELWVLGRNNNDTWYVHHVYKFQKTLATFSDKFVFRYRKPQEILLVSSGQIVAVNYIWGTHKGLYSFVERLHAQPNLVSWNRTQTVVSLSSCYDVVLVNIKQEEVEDIDNQMMIGSVKTIKYIHKKFYLLANKCNGKLGVFLLCFNDEFCNSNYNFLIKKTTKLEIGDAHIMQVHDKVCKVVMTYKSIQSNTYNIFLFDELTQQIEMKFRIPHLYEVPVNSLLICFNNLLIFTPQETRIVSLYSNSKMIIKDHAHGWITQQMLHPMSLVQDMKLEDQNCLDFRLKKNQFIVSIQQKIGNNEETIYEDIYKVKIHKIKMRELLLIYNMIQCRKEQDIVKLIQMQPSTEWFFRTYFEIGRKNMLFILASNSRCMASLIQNSKIQTFDEEFPVIYKVWCGSTSRIPYEQQFTRKKNQSLIRNIGDERCQSAIDIALNENQVISVKILIDHVVKYQNNYVSSFLFKSIFVSLIEKGIEVSHLLNSKIFIFQLDFNWPNTHTDPIMMTVPYNGNIFQLRPMYDSLFGNCLKTDELENKLWYVTMAKKIYKIKYTFNMLPSLLNTEGVTLMEACGNTSELEIFEAVALTDLIEFKWKAYGRQIHYASLFFHLWYQFCFTIGVNQVYMYREAEITQSMLNMMALSLCYQLIYDMTQLFNQGTRSYFSEIWNWTDQFHIWGGLVNIYLQSITDTVWRKEYEQFCKLLIMMLTFLLLIKTFFYMRLLPSMAYLVTMMKTVFSDIKGFLLFFLILVWTVSLIFSTVGLGKDDPTRNEMVRDKTKFKQTEFPGKEYTALPLWIHNWINVLRISLGDFDFGQSQELDSFDNKMFWVAWLIMVIITCIIFMNFIIAEVSNSYTNVTSKVNGFIQQDKAQLIQESEVMIPKKLRDDKNRFPKYIVQREISD